jgi:S-adenosylmethionine-diacylglycerol 3-amino-3-carboxypropyl transferase
MGYLGRDPSFFEYVNDSVSSFLLSSTDHALTELDPASNPYLSWILTGNYGRVLPFYLLPENFEKIKNRIDCLEPRLQSLEEFLDTATPGTVDAFNLSDVFEYMSQENYEKLLGKIIQVGSNRSRLVYWNMMVPRTRPASLSTNLIELSDLAQDLYRKNKTFFYRRLVVEEVQT